MNHTMDQQHGETRAPAPRGAFWHRNRLKALLLGGDAASVFLAFILTLSVTSYRAAYGTLDLTVVAGTATLAGAWAIQSQGLLLARVSAIRAVELTRLARSAAILAALVLLLDRIVHVHLSVRYVVLGCLLSFVLLCAWRSCFRSWLAHARADGRHRRSVAIVGTDQEAVRLIELLATHAEIGMRVVGVIGDHDAALRNGLEPHWLGTTSNAENIVASHDLSGVIIAPGEMPPPRLNELIRHFHTEGRHVHLGTGISGIDARRLRALPLAYEPLFYVEPPTLTRMQVGAKRFFDVVVACVVILVLSPVWTLAALAVKLGDGGPVFFKQTRVGREGRTFEVFKFRSMEINAESRLSELRTANARSGPLFKMDRDPRVTTVGKFLRDSSLDELPQLLNVIRGEMSLVGPRPALPAEVLAFPANLRMRELVRPGITGLWQVEARDSPSFEAYRRLDMFYVENWSLMLDLMILIGTAEQIITRLVHIFVKSPANAESVARTERAAVEL